MCRQIRVLTSVVSGSAVMTETVLLQTLAVIGSAEAIQEQQAEPDSTERYVAGQDHEQSDGQTIAQLVGHDAPAVR